MTSFRADDFQLHRRRLLALAHRWLGSAAEAEDAVQDTWLRVSPGAPERLASEAAWLVTVLRHVCIDRLRRRRIEMRANAVDGPGAVPSAEDTAAVSMGAEVLLRRLSRQVSANDLAALLLHAVFDFGHAEIGMLAGQSAAAMRQRVHRAQVRGRSPERAGLRDSEEHEALFSLCWRALRQRDAAGLIAQIASTPPQLQGLAMSAFLRRATGPSASGTPLRTATPDRTVAVLLHVDGAYALACLFDGIVLCTLPLGPLGPLARSDDAVLAA